MLWMDRRSRTKSERTGEFVSKGAPYMASGCSRGRWQRDEFLVKGEREANEVKCTSSE